MQQTDYIGEQYLIDFAVSNGFSRKIVGHVFHKLVHDAHSGSERFGITFRPDMSLPKTRVRSWDFRLEFMVADLIRVNPNLFCSHGCIEFMVALQNHLREAIAQEAT